MSSQSPITIITTTDETNTKSGLPFGPKLNQKLSVTPEDFSANLKTFIESFNQVIEAQPETLSKGFYIDEIELSLSVNASGGIELVGKAEVGIEGGITLRLKRNRA
jgi:hypothetical protein